MQGKHPPILEEGSELPSPFEDRTLQLQPLESSPDAMRPCLISVARLRLKFSTLPSAPCKMRSPVSSLFNRAYLGLAGPGFIPADLVIGNIFANKLERCFAQSSKNWSMQSSLVTIRSTFKLPSSWHLKCVRSELLRPAGSQKPTGACTPSSFSKACSMSAAVCMKLAWICRLEVQNRRCVSNVRCSLRCS